MWWLLPLAAAAPPEGLDLDDVDAWEAAAESFREGPEGCWELKGTAMMRLVHDAGASPFGRSRRTDESAEGTIDARFEHGRWTRFQVTMTEEPEDWMVVWPVWGTVSTEAWTIVDPQGELQAGPRPADPAKAEKEDEDEDDSGKRRGRSISIGISNDDLTLASYQFARWNEEARAVELIEEYSIEGGLTGKATTTATFPEGRLQASRIRIDLPTTSKIGTWPLQGRLKAASVDLLGTSVAGQVLPHSQRVSFLAGIFGHTLGADSDVTFHEVRRCEAVPLESLPPMPGNPPSEVDSPP